MTVETALYPPQLNTAWPTAADMVSEGDDHIRLNKTVLKTTFPNFGGAVNASHTEANYLVGVTSGIQAQIDAKGAIAGQNWTGAHAFGGTITVPTLAQATSTTGAASTAFVQNEWATRLPNYTAPITASSVELNHMVGVTSGVQSQINAKGAIAGQNWSGTHVFPSTTTVGSITPTIQGYLSTVTSDAQAQINSKATKAGDTYTGTHNFLSADLAVKTQPGGTANNAPASTAFVAAAALSTALPGQTGNAGKFVTTDGSNASWAWPFLKFSVVTGTSVTAVAGNTYSLENAAATTVTLPASPADGDVVAILAANLRDDNVVNRNGNLLMGLAENMNIDNAQYPVILRFRAGKGWRLA